MCLRWTALFQASSSVRAPSESGLLSYDMRVSLRSVLRFSRLVTSLRSLLGDCGAILALAMVIEADLTVVTNLKEDDRDKDLL